MQQIQQRLEYLYEQSSLVTQGNAIDADITRFQDILKQIDELEVDFDRIRHIRDIVRSYRQRVKETERQLEHSTTSSRHSQRHENSRGRHMTAPIANTVSSAQAAYQLLERRNAAATSGSSESPRSTNVTPIWGETRNNKESQMHKAQINFATGGASLGDPSSITSESTQTSSSKTLISQSLPLGFNGQQDAQWSTLDTTEGLSRAIVDNLVGSASKAPEESLNATKPDLDTITLGEPKVKSLPSMASTTTHDARSRFHHESEATLSSFNPKGIVDLKLLKEALGKNEASALKEHVLVERTPRESVSKDARELADIRADLNERKEGIPPDERESHQRLRLPITFIDAFTSVAHFLRRREPPLASGKTRLRWQCVSVDLPPTFEKKKKDPSKFYHRHRSAASNCTTTSLN
jgi:hypothetical protein